MDKRVIVIGSGSSGLVCALELQNLGYDVIILEAQTAIGGRTTTIYLPNREGSGKEPIPINSGASWIHGIVDNPTLKYIDQFNIPTIDNSGQSGFLEHIYYPDGTEVLPEEQDQASNILTTLREKIQERRNESQDQGYTQVINSILEDDNSLRSAFSDPRIGGILEWLLDELGSYNAASLDHLSVNREDLVLGKDLECVSGGDRLVRTYGDLMHAMAKQFSPDKILTDSPVTRISYDPAGGAGSPIRVLTASGKEFVAEKVVVTVSLGVLKSGKIEFSPELPLRKREAIQRSGFGVMNKVILFFEECFWDRDSHSFGCISRTRPYNYWLNLYPVCNEPVLVGFYTGTFAERISGWTKEEVVSDAAQLLRECFGKTELPKLVSSHVTNWGNNPWTLGSYSYNHSDSLEEDQEVLSVPIGNQIYFAGEHLSEDYLGEVSGAIESALEVVESISESDGLCSPTL